MQALRKKKTVNTTDGKKFRKGLIIILTFILILLLLGASAFYLDVVEIDEAHKISINFSNLKLKS